MNLLNTRMLSIVMVCLLIITLGAVPLPIRTNASALHIYPKASISNVKQESRLKLPKVRDLSSQPYPTRLLTSKRSTMLLNKLMYALHKALDNENGEVDKATTDAMPPITDDYPMDLHRRGEDRMTRYWRCYFNAVSCF